MATLNTDSAGTPVPEDVTTAQIPGPDRPSPGEPGTYDPNVPAPSYPDPVQPTEGIPGNFGGALTRPPDLTDRDTERVRRVEAYSATGVRTGVIEDWKDRIPGGADTVIEFDGVERNSNEFFALRTQDEFTQGVLDRFGAKVAARVDSEGAEITLGGSRIGQEISAWNRNNPNDQIADVEEASRRMGRELELVKYTVGLGLSLDNGEKPVQVAATSSNGQTNGAEPTFLQDARTLASDENVSPDVRDRIKASTSEAERVLDNLPKPTPEESGPRPSQQPETQSPSVETNAPEQPAELRPAAESAPATGPSL